MLKVALALLLSFAARTLGVVLNSVSSEEKRCRRFGGKHVVLVNLNLEYLNWGMFENWMISAAPFLELEQQQLVIDVASELVEEKLHDLNYLPNRTAIIDDESEVHWLNDDELSMDRIPVRRKKKRHVSSKYGSTKFTDMMTRRVSQVGVLLKEGCVVLQADIDAVWRANVFEDLRAAGKHDLIVTDDNREGGGIATWQFCGCFIQFMPALVTGPFLDEWMEYTKIYNGNDQTALNKLLQAAHENSTRTYDFAILPHELFPPGCRADMYPGAHVYHANFMKGIDRKVDFFRHKSLWKSHIKPWKRWR